MRGLRRIGFAIVAATALSACSSADTRDVRSDDAIAEVTPPPPRALTFVFDRLEIDPTDNPAEMHSGFDLDDLFSTDLDPGGCAHPDYFAMYDNDQHCANVVAERCASSPNPGCAAVDPDCHGGVDNQLPTLANTIQTAANTDLRGFLVESVAHNELVLLVRISGIDSLANDDSVRVAFYHAFPRFTDGCDRVDPGREYSIDRNDLHVGGSDVDVDARFAFDAAIVNGRLRVTGTRASPVFDVPLSFGGVFLSFPLHALHFRADIGVAALDRGSLGGFTPAGDLVQPSTCWSCQDVARQVLGGLVDIQVDGICSNPPQFGAIGFGFGAHAVAATISMTQPIAEARTPGTCGTPADDAGSGG